MDAFKKKSELPKTFEEMRLHPILCKLLELAGWTPEKMLDDIREANFHSFFKDDWRKKTSIELGHGIKMPLLAEEKASLIPSADVYKVSHDRVFATISFEDSVVIDYFEPFIREHGGTSVFRPLDDALTVTLLQWVGLYSDILRSFCLKHYDEMEKVAIDVNLLRMTIRAKLDGEHLRMYDWAVTYPFYLCDYNSRCNSLDKHYLNGPRILDETREQVIDIMNPELLEQALSVK